VARIALEGVSKVFGSEVVAVDDVSIEIADGEFMVLVGPSGCGKSTILRLLSGLDDVTDGEIWIGDRQVTDLPAKERDVAMIFQNYAIYPHMTVAQNIGFGLKLRHTKKETIRQRVEEVARMLGLEELLERKPATLSGGQRQRVAIGRAIVRDPVAFLMDEPLSNLDAKLRVQMRAEIHQLQRRLGVTTIYVTHDQVEAMTMGDRVAVMNAGHLQQVDTPQVLYDQPVNEFVAGFIGSPSINLVESELAKSNGQLQVSLGEHKLTVDEQVARNRSGLSDYVGKEIILGIRPEDFEDASIEPDTPPDRRIKVTADLTEPLGSEVLVHFSTEATAVVSSAAAADVGEDADVRLGEDEDVSTRLVARVSPKSRIALGQDVELAVDTTRLYFFDPETRATI
jgi:multiple sugar transport system ATP-binding protein